MDDRYSTFTRHHDEILTNPVHPPNEIIKGIKENISASDTSCELVDQDNVDFSLHDGLESQDYLQIMWMIYAMKTRQSKN